MSRWAAGLEALSQSHVWTRGEILAFQTRRLRAVVRHTARRVPYYRRLFAEAGVRPEDIRTLDDLGRIPVTSRFDLQRLPAREATSEDLKPDRLALHTTSGTSGEPLRILRTVFEEYLLRAFRLKQQLLMGMRPTDRGWGIGGTGRPSSMERVPGSRVLTRRLGFQATYAANWSMPTEAVLNQFRQAQPDALVGSASALAWLAGLMTPEDRVRSRPRYIKTSGETCTAEMRRQLTETFGVPVHDEYASHEFNLIASECPQGGRYHIQEWNLILEVLDGDRPVRTGEEGEVVATGLHSFAMPFIRYRLNDLVILGGNPCPCGAPVTTLDRILGRTIERFLLPDGRQVHPYVLVRPLLAGAPWLRRYQIVQDRPDHILVKLVPMSEPGPDAVASVARSVTAALDARVEVDAVLLEDIPPEPNGKYRAYYSLVSEQAQGRGA